MNNRFPSASSTPTASPAAESNKAAFPVKQIAESTAANTQLTMNDLGRLIQELQLTPKLVGSQYDVVYQAEMNDQEIEVFFSLKLTNDHSKVRIRAWLDPLPESEISEKHLLELLAAGSELESCFHFGYNKDVKRFLLEAIVPNQNLTSKDLDTTMLQVSEEVSNTWLLWATSEWVAGPSRYTREAELDSRSHIIPEGKFEMPIRR
ncbi:MAG TPA: hypothetical protein DIW81_01680 [Planctomycetaceae bacterium]|nr:hypothetical protein [Planctomycetaceae bacterium]|tara:strand:- start:11916 stop:12533 length:618 start_codon:yes stop_codon:yes gene_type:complete